MANRKGLGKGKGSGWKNIKIDDSTRHSLASKGIKSAQNIPKLPNKKLTFNELASRPNINVTRLEKLGEITNEQARALRSLDWVYNSTQNIWFVGFGETKFVMNQLDLSRKKADDLILKVLYKLDKEAEKYKR